jgi:hypothetical protein
MGFVLPLAPGVLPPPPPLRDRLIDVPPFCFLESDDARRKRLAAADAFVADIDGDKETLQHLRRLVGGKKPGPQKGAKTRKTLAKEARYTKLLTEIGPWE